MLHFTYSSRVLCLFVGALLLCATDVIAPDPACADVVLTHDGQWWPKNIRGSMKGKDVPTDSVLRRSGRDNLGLAYDKVRIGAVTLNASEVVGFWSTTALSNAYFLQGERQGQSEFWTDAAASFAEAAEALKGAARQIAMWNRVRCLRNTGKVALTFDAAQQFLETFPKTYWFGPAQDLRARVQYIRGDPAAARESLEKIISAPGIGVRDLLEARLAAVYMFDFKPAGRDVAKYAAARGKYEQILSETESRSGVRARTSMQRLKALVGIGKCYLYERDYGRARTHFDRVIDDEASRTARQVLSQAYTGLGDVKYATAKAELAAGQVSESNLAEIHDRLTDAGLDYLRVALHYVTDAGDELYSARVGVARVWATQFALGGEKDCPLALRATRYFYAAERLLGRGEQRRLLRLEAKAFIKRRKEVCGG